MKFGIGQKNTLKVKIIEGGIVRRGLFLKNFLDAPFWKGLSLQKFQNLVLEGEYS